MMAASNAIWCTLGRPLLVGRGPMRAGRLILTLGREAIPTHGKICLPCVGGGIWTIESFATSSSLF